MADNSNQDPLFTNKLAAALLTAALLIFGLPQLTGILMGGGGHHGGEAEELHLAYCCVELETSGEAPAAEAPPDLGTLMAATTAAAGERRKGMCISCHTLDEGGANGTGPNLWNVVGRPVASIAGFNYTNALKEAGGTWTYERLDAYLRNSQEYIPGTGMLQNIRKDNQRADLLAYLGSLSSSPVPFPEPAVVEEVAEETAANDADMVEEAADAVEGVVDAAADAASDVIEGAQEVVEDVVEEATDNH